MRWLDGITDSMDMSVEPPLQFGERTWDCSPGQAGKEGPHLAMTGGSLASQISQGLLKVNCYSSSGFHLHSIYDRGQAFANPKEGLVKEDRKELRGDSGHNYRYVFLIQSVSEGSGGPKGAGGSGAQ